MTTESSTSAYPEHDQVSFDGQNTGAAMFIHQHPAGTLVNHCCCINIYVNNNIQGVTNSILLGSKVIMRDLGVQLSFRKVRRRTNKRSTFKVAQAEKKPSIRYENCLVLCLWLVLLFAFVLLLVLLVGILRTL